MRLRRRLVSRMLFGALLTLSQPGLAQLAFGQESGAQNDDGTEQVPPDMAPQDQAPPDQAPPDQAPAPPVADDGHWWLKRGGSNDFALVFSLQNDYRQFWQFRAEGLSELDDLFLKEVMFGTALAAEEAALKQFEAEGKAQIVVVENHPQIWYASDTEAVIYDPYVSRTYFVDIKTRKPLGDGPNTPVFNASMAYHLTKHLDHFGDLTWKVDDSVGIAR